MGRKKDEKGEERSQIHGVVNGFALRASLRGGSTETKGEDKWASGVPLLHTCSARDLLWAEQDKAIV